VTHEKRRPHYALKRLQDLVQNPATREITASSRVGATKLAWGEEEIVLCVLELTIRDFYKSMTSYYNSKIWQDVYRPTFRGIDLYVKLQISPEERGVVISFKERRPGEQP
jgi:motility quorum-sensing regulator/GCU-specific mRNA interferase toxin